MKGKNFKVFVRVQLAAGALGLLRTAAEAEIRASANIKELMSYIGDCDALICTGPERLYTEALFNVAQRIQVVARVSAGVDMVDVKSATERGILVTNTPGMNASSVAEHGLLLILAITRKLTQCDRMVRNREDYRNAAIFNSLRSTEIANKKLGLIGYGAVARNLAKRALGVGMEVCAYKPRRADELMRSEGIEPMTFETLMGTSDYVVLCCPLTDETQGMINRDTLQLIKPGAYIINIARGGLVVPEDLAAALENGKIAGAALDATTPEPPKVDDPLLGIENVIFSAHQGGNTIEAWDRMCQAAVENTIAVLRAERPPNLVNPEAYAFHTKRFGNSGTH